MLRSGAYKLLQPSVGQTAYSMQTTLAERWAAAPTLLERGE
jgi:hypothetical protein